jgi:hypothetical protein
MKPLNNATNVAWEAKRLKMLTHAELQSFFIDSGSGVLLLTSSTHTIFVASSMVLGTSGQEDRRKVQSHHAESETEHLLTRLRE